MDALTGVEIDSVVVALEAKLVDYLWCIPDGSSALAANVKKSRLIFKKRDRREASTLNSLSAPMIDRKKSKSGQADSRTKVWRAIPLYGRAVNVTVLCRHVFEPWCFIFSGKHIETYGMQQR